MTALKTVIPDVFVISNISHNDERGQLIKPYSASLPSLINQTFEIQEVFYSISKKNVIRGMHFQTPPHAVSKLIYVTEGAVVDVVLDIRTGSPTYGRSIQVELSSENAKSIYVPEGCAHGFVSLSNKSCVTYLQSKQFDSECDKGINYNSFDYQWNIKKPIVSSRDLSLVNFANFQSPFVYKQKAAVI